jgi:hypothetical protein
MIGLSTSKTKKVRQNPIINVLTFKFTTITSKKNTVSSSAKRKVSISSLEIGRFSKAGKTGRKPITRN